MLVRGASAQQAHEQVRVPPGVVDRLVSVRDVPLEASEVVVDPAAVERERSRDEVEACRGAGLLSAAPEHFEFARVVLQHCEDEVSKGCEAVDLGASEPDHRGLL